MRTPTGLLTMTRAQLAHACAQQESALRELVLARKRHEAVLRELVLARKRHEAALSAHAFANRLTVDRMIMGLGDTTEQYVER